jgi:hypothetical protein
MVIGLKNSYQAICLFSFTVAVAAERGIVQVKLNYEAKNIPESRYLIDVAHHRG